MPELPEVELYLHALRPRVIGRTLTRVRVRSPSLLKTHDPPLGAAEGREVVALRRIGKRIVWSLDGDLHLVFHLMIAGRLRWREAGAAVPKKLGHAALDFEHGTVLLTEAGTRKRASLWLVLGEDGLAAHDPGGIEPLDAEAAAFAAALSRRNHTLKRALTDPRVLSGIGNAHSDEILHRARLSPFRRTSQLTDQEIARLHEAVRTELEEWRERLKEETGDRFPEKVSAFHPAMRVHGRYRQPCPACGAPIQRVVYASNEMNYCARCQTDGRLLADRALSRLLRDDWPRTLDELENPDPTCAS